jgi:hypothetical protein
MSTENQGNPPDESSSTDEQGSARTQDSVLAEVNRKFNKYSEENKKLSDQIAQLANLVSRQQPTQGKSASTDADAELEELSYSNPKEYARRVTMEARKEAQKTVSQAFQQQQDTNSRLAQLAQEYPELADNNSDLTKKAVDIYKNMPEDERMERNAYKVAVREAAAELALLPKAKRTAAAEPNISGKGSEPSKGRGSSSSSSSKIDEKTLEIARLMGLNVDDKKQLERLQKRAERKNWGRHE